MLLVLRHKIDRDGTSEALSVYEDLGVSRFGTMPNIIQTCLRIDIQAVLVGRPGGQSVAAILEHENIASKDLDKDFGDRNAMADIASISVEHKYCKGMCSAFIFRSDEERIERLAVRGGKLEVFKVRDPELRRLGHIGARIRRNVPRVDQLTSHLFVSSSSQTARLAGPISILLFEVQETACKRCEP